MAEKNGKLKTEMVPVASLKPHPKNYRNHPDDQLGHIVQSITEHGVYRAIVVARDNTILAGHGVVKALAKMGRTEAPVHRLDVDPESPAALRVLTGDNEISKLGEIDDRALSELLKGIKDSPEGLLGTGFDEMMLANLAFVTRSAAEMPDFDSAAAWAGAGLPSYERVGKSPQLVIAFDNEADREKFWKLVNEPIIHKKMGDGRLWSTWWPSRPRSDAHVERFEEEKDEPPEAGSAHTPANAE